MTDVPSPRVKTNISVAAIATMEAETLFKTVNFIYYSSGVGTDYVFVLSVITLR